MPKAWCPILSKNLSSETIASAYPYQSSSACVTSNTLEANDGNQLVVDQSWEDLINTAGQQVYYYVYGFDMNRANKLYGEDILAEYQEPFEIRTYIEFQDVPRSLSQYGGWFSEDTITMYFHIKTFQHYASKMACYEELNLHVEPKPQDIVEIINYGCDRPGERGANLFEITNKEDQLISASLNPYYSHSVWKVTAKRYIASAEGGKIPELGEDGNCQAYDNRISGVLSDGKDEETQFQDKSYSYNIDEESRTKIFDQRYQDNDKQYGGYYQ